MRDLKRNEIDLWYCLYLSKQAVYDGEGNDTGITKTGYGTPVHFRANMSANKNTSEGEPFGTELDYSKIISTCKELPINEYSLIFESEPQGEITQNKADYYVSKVAKSINSTLYAIKSIAKTRG